MGFPMSHFHCELSLHTSKTGVLSLLKPDRLLNFAPLLANRRH